MAMTSRERMLTALNNGRPDRLPCQVHGWMGYWLKKYCGGIDGWQAFEKFGMDFAIYISPPLEYSEKDLANWEKKRIDLGVDDDGNKFWEETITTPKGTLHQAGTISEITPWSTEDLLKTEQDFEIWNEFFPCPISADVTPVKQTKDKLGDRGIIRSHPWGGNGNPWMSFCMLFGTQEAIMLAIDKPDFVHHALEEMLKKGLHANDLWEGIEADVVETGGGPNSNTVISPKMFKEFSMPYDIKLHEALHQHGVKIVYHMCGGLMHMLDLALENGTDGIETMTPPSMGGDCDLREASRRVGDRLFFIGGFDQNAGFENGTPESARRLVIDCFEATKDHAGYICCPSDHFFHGDAACVQAFADAAKECVY